MARIRTVKPEFFTSEDVCSLPPIARLFFVACWCEADREGRLEWKPRTMKLRYFPADNDDIEEVAAKVVKQGLVRLYEADGKSLAVIPSFLRHQHINPREAASTLPAPPSLDGKMVTREHASARVDDASSRDTDAQVGKEGKGKEESPPTPQVSGSSEDDGDWVSRLSGHDRALAMVWRATGSADEQIRQWLTTTKGPHRERIAGWMRDGIPADRLPGIIIDILDRLEGSDGALRAGGNKPINDIWAYLAKAVPSMWARAQASEAVASERIEGGSPPEPWPQRLAGFHSRAIWLPAWGPKPGEPGCRVPAKLLGTRG